MTRETVDHPEHRRAPDSCETARKGARRLAGIGDSPRGIGIEQSRQRWRQRQRIAVEPELERRSDRRTSLAQAERHRERERGKHVRRLDLPRNQPVAHCRPRQVADQRQVEVMLLGEAALFGRDQDCAVGQRNEGDRQRGHLRPPSSRTLAVISASAMSPSRRLWFIAVVRSKA